MKRKRRERPYVNRRNERKVDYHGTQPFEKKKGS